MRKRVIITFTITLLFIAGLIGRLGYLFFSEAYTVSEGYNTYSVLIDNVEPNLYYSNGAKLTNNKKEYCVVLRPNENTVAELSKVFTSEDLMGIIEELQQGKPIVKRVNKSSYGTNYIKTMEYRTSESTCRQLLSKQSSGLMTYLPDSVGKRKMSFSIDAKGRLLSGDEGRIVDDNYFTNEGLKLTLDKKIQQITYNACMELQKGCVIVMDVSDSSILACVTKPDNTYINKAVQQYAVGSVFKIVVAACAIENNVDLAYYCSSKITVGDTTYSCYEENKHGRQTLREALANSCNCYFVNLALALGPDKILETAKKLGFDDSSVLFDDWNVKNASLPTRQELTSKGELALFGFGQGKLTASPLQFCSLMCTIGNNGVKTPIRLVSASVDAAGRETEMSYNSGEQVISEETAKKLITDMRYVVTNGNSRSADYNGKSAGKTATAQTGQFQFGNELLNTWFAGIYPYDNPQYAIVVLTEEGTGGARDCCPIFRTIVENLDKI